MTASSEAPRLMGSAPPLVDPLDEQRALANVSAGLLGQPTAAVQIDRFVVLERVGAGGMGTVYAAYDPQLDRKVAIKVLHSGGGDDDDDDDVRLLREARAVAQINHPNVVTIHEVGTFDGRPFLAMELVNGESLSAWSQRPRDWRETLGVLAAAADGLIAAHATGVVHRDFKPSNVAIGEDGRVLVLDFGLASTESTTELVRGDPDDSAPRRRAGTPAYMAPEQHDGESATMASDQFSFCVSAYEALFGQLPFATRSADQLRQDIEARSLAPPSTTSRVPARVRKVILRGLDPDPRARWPSMVALVGALRRAAGRRWTRVASPVVAVGAVGLAGFVAWGTRPPACSAVAAAELEPAWNDNAEAAVRAALERVDHSPEHAVVQRVASRLNQFAAAWGTARAEACELERGGLEPLAAAEQSSCLAEQRQRLVVALELLGAADRRVALDADEIVPDVGGLALCRTAQRRSVGATVEASPPPRGMDMARAEVLATAGRSAEARAMAEAVMAQASEHKDLAARSRARRLLGELASHEGEHANATEHLSAAVVDAERAGDTVARLDALRALAGELIETASDREAERLLDQVEAAHERFDPRPSSWDAALLHLRAKLALERTQLDDAEAFAQQRLALVLARGAEEPHRVLSARLLLAQVATHQVPRGGEGTTALARWAEVRELVQAAYGPVHPMLAVVESSTSVIFYRRGEQKRATEAIQRSIAITEQVRGSDHPSLLPRLINLGVFVVPRDPEAARDAFERAASIARKDGETSKRLLGSTLHNLGGVEYALRRYDDATRHLREALEIYTELRGKSDGETVAIMNDLATTLLEVDRRGEALDLLERARAIERSERGPDSPLLLGISLAMIQALDESDRAEEALALALEAADRARSSPIPPTQKLSLNNSLILLLLDKGDPESLARARVALDDARAVADHPSVSDEARQLVTDRAADLEAFPQIP